MSNDNALPRMANQISDFFDAQMPNSPDDAAAALAAHLKLFWAPSMRAQFAGLYDRGELEAIRPTVRLAMERHRDTLVTSGAHVREEAVETYPQGGGDAG